MTDNHKGLWDKYIVTKTSGKPVEPGSRFIVLRIDGGRYVHPCRAGAAAFAEAVRSVNRKLANDIQNLLDFYNAYEEAKDDRRPRD